MQIRLSSGNYDIVSSGMAFLYGPDRDLTIEIVMNEFSLFITMYFLIDTSQDQRIDKEVTGNKIILKCYNFADAGTGLIKPVEVAQIEGKKLYLMFWAYLEGSIDPKIRSIQYTIFCEN